MSNENDRNVTSVNLQNHLHDLHSQNPALQSKKGGGSHSQEKWDRS